MMLAWPWAQANGALQPVPALTARAIDQTGTLDERQLQALEAQLRALEQKRGSQVAVLMVKTTAPEDIAAYAHRVASEWKIGRREVGDGVLLVVAKDDRRMRIEVARALEGAIPDIAAARIIDSQMKPRFRQDDYAGGLAAALVQLDALIGQEALPESRSSPRGPANDSDEASRWRTMLMFLGIAAILALGQAYIAFGGRGGRMLTGGAVGAATFAMTSHILLSVAAGVAAMVYMWNVFRPKRPGPRGAIHSGGGRGGWGSGGGFRSGGGGSFGGGGASGSW